MPAIWGLDNITVAHRPAGDRYDHAVALMFAPGHRPRAEEIRALSASLGQFAVTIECSNPAEEVQWMELLANGLTFDLTGLEPGKPRDAINTGHVFGLAEEFDPAICETIALAPGPHLTSGGAMIPVVRCLAWLAAEMASLPHIRAISWRAARTICAPEYYHDSVMRWIGGGAFPGLGLTALVPQPDGSMISEGLGLFTGQELRLDASLASDRSHGAKVAVRLLHWLVENGRVDQTMSLTGPSGEALVLEPQPELGFIKVWSGSR